MPVAFKSSAKPPAHGKPSYTGRPDIMTRETLAHATCKFMQLDVEKTGLITYAFLLRHGNQL